MIIINHFYYLYVYGFMGTPAVWRFIGHTFGVRVQKVQKVQRVQRGKVLRIDRPDGRKVLKFDGAFGPEGCGIALTGDEYYNAAFRRSRPHRVS